MEYVRLRICSELAVEPGLIRYVDLVPLTGLDSAVAVEAHAEHFRLIESDASDPAAADACIALPHGFNLQAERRVETGSGVGHSSPSAEVLIVHTGRWRLTLGSAGEYGSTDLVPGDVASVPPDLWRNWERLDGEVGVLFIVQGLRAGVGPDQRTAVSETLADERRWVQDGRFIDYSSGLPRMKEVSDRPHARAAPGEPFAASRISAELIAPNDLSALTARGVAEAGILSPPGTRDGFAQGAIKAAWPHGFNLRWLTLRSGAYAPRHTRAETEVTVVQAGTLEVSWADAAMMLGAGDVLSVPAGLPHALRNPTSQPTHAFVVRGSDDPAMPQFDSMPTLMTIKTSHPSSRS